MRKIQPCMVSKLSTFFVLGVIAVAVAQSDEPAKNQDAKAHQQKETDGKSNSGESPSILQRFEDMVGLRARIKQLSNTLENLEAEMSKMRSLQDQADDSTPSLVITSVSPQPPETTSGTAQIESPNEVVPPLPPLPAQANIDAERVSSDSFALVSNDSLEDKFAMPVLSGDTPDWVKNGLNGTAQGDEHSFAISSTYLPDLEQCREELKSNLMTEVRLYLEKNVLRYTNAKLPELTQEYVEKYWVKRGQVFDNVTDRASGTYHQAWIGLHISSEQIAKVREWEKHGERDLRIKKAGILGGASVFAITLLSGAVGLLARREKAKLKG